MSQSQIITEAPVNQIPPRRGRPRLNPAADPGGLGSPPNPRAPRLPRGSGTGLNLQQVCAESRRQAAAVLEVLAGVRTPRQAAQELGMALPVYYKLEQRALASVVEACQPRPRGPRPSPDRDLAVAKRECETLSRELHRQQALTRAAQRAIGLSAVPTTRPSDKSPDKSPGKRPRKPMARALRAIAELRQPQQPPNVAEPPASGA
jgi:hypothetical protein